MPFATSFNAFFRRLMVMAITMLLTLAGPAGAQQLAAVPMPEIPPAAKGEQCVAPTDLMRRNHMDMLKHKRDKTVHDGDRTPQFALTECISCHAVEGDDGKAVTVADPRHFCRTCHDYAAVTVDCFQCHASRPEGGDTALNNSPHGKNILALTDYLREIGQ